MVQWCCGNYMDMGSCLIYGKCSVNVNYYSQLLKMGCMIMLHVTNGLFYFR